MHQAAWCCVDEIFVIADLGLSSLSRCCPRADELLAVRRSDAAGAGRGGEGMSTSTSRNPRTSQIETIGYSRHVYVLSGKMRRTYGAIL